MATATSHIPERRHPPNRRSNESDMTARHMNAVDWIALTLLIIGGLNWGLVGLFNFNVVAALFGDMSALSRIIYVVVGLSALYSIYTSSKMSRGRH